MAGPPTIAETYGPMYIGLFFSTILYGVTFIQTVIYFQTSKRDRAWMRYFVLYIFIAETVSAAVFFTLLWEPLIEKAGQLEVRITSPFLLRADGPITAAIATPVQLFMAWRIKVISGSYLLSGFIAALSVVSFGGGIWLGVSVAGAPEFQRFDEFKRVPALWLGTAAIADVLIAVSLVWFLLRRKSNIVSTTNDHIDRIVRLTVQTGTITAIAALLDIIVYAAIPHTTYFFILDFSISKLYSNSVLSSLNARTWGVDSNQTNANVGVLSNFSASSQGRVPTSQLTSHNLHTSDIELGLAGHPNLKELSVQGEQVRVQWVQTKTQQFD